MRAIKTMGICSQMKAMIVEVAIILSLLAILAFEFQYNNTKASAHITYSELSLFRSPMGLPQVAGISRWPHFRVPRDTRGYVRDSVTCIFSSMQGHCIMTG